MRFAPDTPTPIRGGSSHALADTYAAAALAAGHDVRRIAVAGLAFDLLEESQEWEVIVVSVLLCAVCATVIGQKKILAPGRTPRGA